MSSQDSMSESDKKSPTACVVGAGISGVSSALFLAKKGYKVTVVDQRELVADGATAAASGVLSSVPLPRLSYWHISKQRDNLVAGFNDIETNVASKSNILKSFGNAFSALSGRAAAAFQLDHLNRLASANRFLALELMNSPDIDIPFQSGELAVHNSSASDNLLTAMQTQSMCQSPIFEAAYLDHLDCFRVFPPTLIKENKPKNATLYPNSVVVNPVQMTGALANECKRLGVDFQMSTRVLELKPSEDRTKIESIVTSNGEIKADQYVIAAGFPSSTLCSDIVEQGTLAPVIPVKNYALTVRETTDHRTVKEWLLPTFFPSYPTRYLNDRSESEGRREGTTMFPSSVLMGEQMLRVEADPENPRIYRVTTGNEYHNINAAISQSLTEIVIDKLKKLVPISQFAAEDVKASTGYSGRRQANEPDRQIVGIRHFAMKKPVMGLHCVPMDGIPLVGKTPVVDNLYLNTGHGTDPMNTALIGGHTLAQIMKNDFTQQTDPFHGIELETHVSTDDAFYIDPRIVDPRRFKPMDVPVEHAFDFTNKAQ